MAKENTPAALVTPELPGLRRRGRPSSGKALTNAQRQALWRASNRPRQPLEVAQLDALAARVRSIQDEMCAQAVEIFQDPALKPLVESWYREMHEIRLALLGR